MSAHWRPVDAEIVRKAQSDMEWLQRFLAQREEGMAAAAAGQHARVRAALDLHHSTTLSRGLDDSGEEEFYELCVECGQPWPCRTRKALEGGTCAV